MTLHFYIILWWKNDFCDFWSCCKNASQHASACTDSPPTIVIDELVKCENWRILETIKEMMSSSQAKGNRNRFGEPWTTIHWVFLHSKWSDHFESTQISLPDLFWFNNTNMLLWWQRTVCMKLQQGIYVVLEYRPAALWFMKEELYFKGGLVWAKLLW